MKTFSRLTYFPFTTSEIELDYYQESECENFLTSCQTSHDLHFRKLGSFKKISEMLWNPKQVISWPHKIKILTAALENAKNQLFSQISLFHVNPRIRREYFIQNCLKKHWFIFNSAHTPWNLKFLKLLRLKKGM